MRSNGNEGVETNKQITSITVTVALNLLWIKSIGAKHLSGNLRSVWRYRHQGRCQQLRSGKIPFVLDLRDWLRSWQSG